MKQICLFILLFLTLMLSVNQSYASVTKAFEALEMQDYFKAKRLFKKGLKYNPEASSFGLSVIYSRNDNPFFSPDSAYKYVVMADTAWDKAKDRKKEKWKVYGWDRSGIDSMMQIVSDQFFQKARKNHTVNGYSKFLTSHPWSIHFNEAKESRDSLAFFEALQKSNSEALDEFLELYPGSSYEELAQQSYHQIHFKERTTDGSIDSYLTFIEENNDSPMIENAYEKIYHLSTASNKPEDYELFVLGYPDNIFNERAWREYYQLYISEYSSERMKLFLDKYPFTPIVSEIEEEIELHDKDMLINSVILDSFQLFGYMDTLGNQQIDYAFTEAYPFNDGLALVVKDNKYGFINKKGEFHIPAEYDAAYEFHEGRCVVEKNGKLGLIDRNNRILLPFIYEDLGDVSDGRIYISKEEKYGYADENGVLMIPEKFNEAFNFSKGSAQVQFDDRVGMINRYGEFIIEPKYDELVALTDSIVLCSINGKKGLLTNNGTIIIEPQFTQIGKFKDGLVLAAKQDTLLYLDQSGEIIIDKGYKTYPNFLFKGEFSNGGAIVFKKGKYGRINTYGNVITDIKYQNLGRGEAFIPFQKDDFWGLMTVSNRVLVSPKHESLDLIDEKYLIVRNEDSVGVLDLNGNVLIPFSFDLIEYLQDGYFVVSNVSKSGLYRESTAIADVKYDLIKPFDANFVTLIDKGNYEYYDRKRRRLIRTNIGNE